MQKLIAEFRYLQANATGTLSKFLEYITYAYMIDNVALLITGTLHERDTRELLERCHPLGWFETLPVLCVATNIEELYNSVLIETPLAPYFKGSISHQDLDELNIEIVRNTLYKNYLEDFYRFVNEESGIKGTPTQGVMSEILEFEADRRSINITLNSFGTELSKQERKKLYPNFGRLHPEGTLMLSRADDAEGVRIAVDGVYDYRTMMDQTGMGGNSGGLGNQSGGVGGDEGKSLEDLFYAKEMEMSKIAFTYQFTHAVAYGWVKLKEQVCCFPTPCLGQLLTGRRKYGISRGLLSASHSSRKTVLAITYPCFRYTTPACMLRRSPGVMGRHWKACGVRQCLYIPRPPISTKFRPPKLPLHVCLGVTNMNKACVVHSATSCSRCCLTCSHFVGRARRWRLRCINWLLTDYNGTHAERIP